LLRRKITDFEEIKAIVTAAFYEKPIVILPIFSDPLKARPSLIEKGIIYRQGDNYYFTF